MSGGGGGGGRVAILASASYTYKGKHTTYGGVSTSEEGGAGTVYTHAPNDAGVITSYLYVDNRGNRPQSTYLTDALHDSARAYIHNEPNFGVSRYDFDHVTILNGAHLAYNDTAQTKVPVTMQDLHGDLSGFLHVGANQHITISDSDSPFPAAFRVYEDARLSLPKGELIFMCMMIIYTYWVKLLL